MSDRRLLYWDRVKGPREGIALVVATAGGAGLLPLAPGTWGTVVGVAVAWLTADWEPGARVALWLSLFIAGVWASTVVDETMGTQDNQNIVMDEVVGLGITAWTVGAGWMGLLASFLIFRFFDIVKPPPVRQIDRWSHKAASTRGSVFAQWIGGFGVMADDAVAGIQGLVVILLLQHFGILN